MTINEHRTKALTSQLIRKWCSALQPQLWTSVIQLAGDRNLVYKIKHVICCCPSVSRVAKSSQMLQKNGRFPGNTVHCSRVAGVWPPSCLTSWFSSNSQSMQPSSILLPPCPILYREQHKILAETRYFSSRAFGRGWRSRGQRRSRRGCSLNNLLMRIVQCITAVKHITVNFVIHPSCI